MKRIAFAVVVVAGLAAASVAAQQRTLDETLAYVNQILRANTYTDHDGQPTVSEVRLGTGTLTVVITKTKAGNTFANMYEVALADLDIMRVRAYDRGDFTSVSLGARGPVTVTLECTMVGGVKHHWDLPDTKEIAVELQSDASEERDLTRALTELIVEARKDPRFGVS